MTSDRDRLQKTRDFQLEKMYERMTKKQRQSYENCDVEEQESETSFGHKEKVKNKDKWRQWAEQGTILLEYFHINDFSQL